MESSNNIVTKNESEIEESNFPYVPKIVDKSDLQPNNKLLSERQIMFLKEWFSVSPHEVRTDVLKFRKEMFSDLTEQQREVLKKWGVDEENQNGLSASFDVLKVDDENGESRYMAIYYGSKHQKRLGAGGSGDVKLAQDLSSGEWLAIKLMSHPEKIKKAAQEARLMSEVPGNTAYVIHRLDKKKGKEQGIVLMNFFPGMNLVDFINSQKNTYNSKPPSWWLNVGINILKSIDQLHALGILHRDIKLDNIIINPQSGDIRLIDFGSAAKVENYEKGKYIAIAEMQSGITTPAYAAPEVKRGLFTRGTDLYAAAETLNGLFKNPDLNPFGTNFSLIEDVSKFLSEMKLPQSSQRPEFSKAIEWFEDKYNHCEDVLQNKSKVAIIDIGEYLNSEGQAELNLRLAMDACDEIWFVDPDKKYQSEYLSLRETLESRYCPPITKLFSGPADLPALVKNIPDYVEKKSSDYQGSSFYYITSKVDNIEQVKNTEHLCCVSLQHPGSIREAQKLINNYHAKKHLLQKQYITAISVLEKQKNQIPMSHDQIKY